MFAVFLLQPWFMKHFFKIAPYTKGAK